ncbi:MAG: hypothetical protein NDF58_05910 [archaeon YNP-LCB-024-027]|nr:hypothetical protein [Candidatus Culexarchaeum yellowstonense]
MRKRRRDRILHAIHLIMFTLHFQALARYRGTSHGGNATYGGSPQILPHIGEEEGNHVLKKCEPKIGKSYVAVDGIIFLEHSHVS